MTPEQPTQDSSTLDSAAPPAKRVSVVIVSFNRAGLLRRSLAALGDEHQVLVVDNGSSDGTPLLADDFPAARFIRLPKNFGLTKAMNIGFRAADGEYVLFLHDDTVLSGDGVTKMADFLEARQDAAAVCPLLVTESGQPSWQVRPLPTPSEPDPGFRPAANSAPVDGEILAECVSGAAIMVRISFLRAMRHVDERYGNYGSEIELSSQVRRAGKKLVILGGVTAVHEGPLSPMRKGQLAGDRADGTAGYLGKNFGFVTGMLHRLKAGLGGLLTFRLGVVAGALAGEKIDGA